MLIKLTDMQKGISKGYQFVCTEVLYAQFDHNLISFAPESDMSDVLAFTQQQRF